MVELWWIMGCDGVMVDCGIWWSYGGLWVVELWWIVGCGLVMVDCELWFSYGGLWVVV